MSRPTPGLAQKIVWLPGYSRRIIAKRCCGCRGCWFDDSLGEMYWLIGEDCVDSLVEIVLTHWWRLYWLIGEDCTDSLVKIVLTYRCRWEGEGAGGGAEGFRRVSILILKPPPPFLQALICWECGSNYSVHTPLNCIKYVSISAQAPRNREQKIISSTHGCQAKN